MLISLEWRQTQQCPSTLGRHAGAQNSYQRTSWRHEEARWHPLITLGFVKKIGVRGMERKWTTLTVFKGHIGAGRFKALDGTHCWVRRWPAESASDQADSQTWCRGRSPRPSWLHRFVCHPWTLTYRARALGVQGLPHHQGHSNEWGRETQKPHSGSLRAQPRPQRWQTTGLTREAKQGGRWRGKAVQSLPHDPATSVSSALSLVDALPTRDKTSSTWRRS